MGGSILGVDFEGQAAERTPVPAFRSEDALAVAGENGEDAAHRFFNRGEGRVDHHGAEQVQIAFEDLPQQRFLAVEEVIEASGIDFGVRQQLRHAGAGESALPEQVAGGFDEAITG